MRQILINYENDSQITINLDSNTLLPGSYINAEYKSQDYLILELENLIEKIGVNRVGVPKVNTVSGYTTNTKEIKTYDDVIEHFKETPEKYFVTGYTDSKFNLISKFFDKNRFLDTNKLNLTKKIGDENNQIITIQENLVDNMIIRSNVNLDIPGLDMSAMILSESKNGAYEYILYLNTENPIKYIDLPEGLTIFKYMRSHNQIESEANLVVYDGIIDEPKIVSEVFIDRGLNSAFERMKKLKNITSINELNKLGLGYYKINTKGYNFKNN
jgi:hypothetical protein